MLNGFPAHKLSITSGIKFNSKFTLAPTLIYNSRKIGYYYQEEFWENYAPAIYDPNLTINLTTHYEVIKDLNLSFGVYDLLNERYVTANAYDAGYKGTPLMGREFIIKASLKF